MGYSINISTVYPDFKCVLAKKKMCTKYFFALSGCQLTHYIQQPNNARVHVIRKVFSSKIGSVLYIITPRGGGLFLWDEGIFV
jgi:hypothetical protein